jgi:hypothetical protein
MPPSDERRVTSGSRGEESGFINVGGITEKEREREKREYKTSNERTGRQRETEVQEAMLILDKRVGKRKISGKELTKRKKARVCIQKAVSGLVQCSSCEFMVGRF